MAKTQDIKRRIRSVQNTRQLTKAMKMVSAAKLRRAENAIVSARPYANEMLAVLRSLAARANPELHPLLQQREPEKVEGVVLTGDKGLCGGFNSAIIRLTEGFVEEARGKRDLTLNLVGKRGRDYFRSRKTPIKRERADVFRNIDYTVAKDIAADLMERFIDGELDAIYLVYNEFKSMIAQRPVVERLLPLEPIEAEASESAEDYIYEPDAKTLFDALLPRHVEVQVYRALLESAAAEHAARMTAMDAATRNAGELIDKLTLHMNRVRQAAITTEIIEVVSGAGALS